MCADSSSSLIAMHYAVESHELHLLSLACNHIVLTAEMEAIAAKLDAVQQQLAESKQDFVQLANSQAAMQASMAQLQSTLSKQTGTTSASSADESQQHCKKLARRADDCVSPLDKDVILDEVFSFVGGGDYYYAAGVSRRWRGRYIKLCYTEAESDDDEKPWTSYKSAVMTAARLQLALDSGLTMAELEQSDNLAVNVVCSVEPSSVLTLLKLYDMDWTTKFATAAADAEDLKLLQWLHKYGCPLDLKEVADFAAWCETADMLIWLRKVTEPWPQKTLDKCMRTAGGASNLAGVKWLREQGAAWPDRFMFKDDPVKCWDVAATQFAIQHGAGWDTWKCAENAPVNYICSGVEQSGGAVHNDAACEELWCSKRNAAQMFKWAHENGCPCTCEADAAAAAAAV
jgi:cell division protein FtsB